ncbi:hypothetical protein F2P56_000670 [Juglans regia]|uniref:Alpha/beta hydrolase fold-3 domain-containing protein n=2 Tax=Juglans regia TaxID=51240 RepID=A0A833YBA0_JUGRE|nr:probable carboxylesterase 17 [Juglans regia]KAF5479887.1 hypothetical protein F2P56_000670 [Juglans regia]
MRTKRMAASISLDPRSNLQVGRNPQQHGVIEEIEGLIKVFKDGHVERPPIVPIVPCTMGLERGVTANDVVVDKCTSLWARIYVPSCPGKLPLLVYFHGGGFCIGSAAWSCYSEFLSNLASKANCVIISVNYRLAPENRLPAAYEDGFNTLMWVKQQALLNGSGEDKCWLKHCNLSNMYLAGDSSGANIAYNVATRLGSRGPSESTIIRPLSLKGIILIQPFFGGEALTWSERYTNQPPNSALTLSVSHAYWRLSLPLGAKRDHPWCNPLANGAAKLRDLRLPTIMVCISEMDILKDRNLEFCSALISAGKRVETVMYKGVGHSFQILHNSQLSQTRIHDMMSHLKAFINE